MRGLHNVVSPLFNENLADDPLPGSVRYTTRAVRGLSVEDGDLALFPLPRRAFEGRDGSWLTVAETVRETTPSPATDVLMA